MKAKNQTAPQSNDDALNTAIEKLENARQAVEQLVECRKQNKLSTLRASNVVKELSDLMKVLSVYQN